MIHEDLFQHILIEPAKTLRKGRLRIVSGFATANMASSHMQTLHERDLVISIDLIIGMTVREGIQEAQHRAFLDLVGQSPWGIDLSCYYLAEGDPVHAKSYVWLDDLGNPKKAFCGSANYTVTGFSKGQVEGMSDADPVQASIFFDKILQRSKDCSRDHMDTQVKVLPNTKHLDTGNGLDHVSLSFLDSQTGETPKKSGINWGQRSNRNHDQAYIQIPARVGRSGFFPERKEQFTVITDDSEIFLCVRAQDGGKGIHTTRDNSLLGHYFRKRLGIGSGEYVTKQHLVAYGRTDVTFFKIDQETYLMDFRPNVLGIGGKF